MAETIGVAYVKILADGTEFAGHVKQVVKKSEPEIEKSGEGSGKSFSRGFKKGFKGEFRDGKDTEKTFNKLTTRLHAMGNKVGRIFGKGSRNDLVNFFGSLIGGLANIPAAISGGIGAVVDFGKQLKKTFQGAGGGVEGLGAVLGELASAGLPGLVAALAVAGIAITAFKLLIGPLGSAISLLTGLVLALAGSLGFALVGALAAVGGALVPFAAAFGVAALAMSGLNKKSGAFKDLKKQWKDLQKSTAEHLFGKDMGGLGVISGLLKTVKPLIDGVADAMHGLLTELGKATQSKGFQDMMKSIADALPGMVTQLGNIAGNIGTFLGEAFVAAEPMIKEFLGWLEKVTGQLADFGKVGKGGKSGLSDFFTKAWDSAKKVGRVILDIIGIVGRLFSAGKDTGDSIFEKLAGWLEDGLKKLDEWSKDGTLDQFFADAGKLGDKIGDVVVAVGELIDALDTPANRSMLFTLLDVATGIIKGLASVIRWAEKTKTAIAQFFLDVVGFFQDLGSEIAAGWSDMIADVTDQASFMAQGIVDAWNGIVDGVTGIATAISEWWNQLITDITTSFTDMITDISDQWSFMTQGLSDAIDAIVQFFVDLWNTLVGNSIIPDLIDEIVRLFTTLPGLIISGIGDLGAIFAQWVIGVPQAIGALLLAIAQGFSGLATKVMAKAGNIAAAFGTWAASLPAKAASVAKSIASGFVGLAKSIISRAGSVASAFASWVSSLAGKARSTAVSIASAFAGLAGKMIAKAGSIASAAGSWLASLPGKARAIAGQIAQGFAGLAGKMIAKAGDIGSKLSAWGHAAVTGAGRVASGIVGEFRGLASKIVAAIGTIIPKIKMPNIARPVVDAIVKVAKPGASGFITAGPQTRLIGEAGPEAVVPLNRPLSQVDPAVRMLSAIAQGKISLGGGGGRPGKTIDIGGITINTPTENPRAVAAEVVAHMAAAAYI